MWGPEMATKTPKMMKTSEFYWIVTAGALSAPLVVWACASAFVVAAHAAKFLPWWL